MFRSRCGAAITPVKMKLRAGKQAWQITSFHMHFLVIKCNFNWRVKPQHIKPILFPVSNSYTKAEMETLRYSLVVPVFLISVKVALSL